jgi:hypothetical protein
MPRNVGMTGVLVGGLIMALAVPAQAQSRGGRTGAWTAVGAGAGFGVGLWAGLTAFDDAIDSDRKVWTSAIVGAAVGGTLAFFVARSRRGGPSPSIAGGARPARRAARAALPIELGAQEVERLAASALPRRGGLPGR